MGAPQQRSGSVPPPVNAANPVAGRYAASLMESGDVQDQAPASRDTGRSLSQSLTPLAGLYFLARGLIGIVLLIQSLPHVTSNPYQGTNGEPSTGWTVSSGFGLWWMIAAGVALASLYASWKILKSDERGRGVGVLLALIGIAFALVSLSKGTSAAGLGLLAVNAFVLWILMASSFPERR
jgi:hypothetical protein